MRLASGGRQHFYLVVAPFTGGERHQAGADTSSNELTSRYSTRCEQVHWMKIIWCIKAKNKISSIAKIKFYPLPVKIYFTNFVPIGKI